MDKGLHKEIFDHGNCLSQSVLLDYAQNRLSRADRNKVEKHLSDCELCSDAVEGFMLIRNPNSLPKINAAVAGRFGTEEVKKGKIVKLEFRTALAIAASIALVVVSVFFFRSTLEEDKTVADLAEKKEVEKENMQVPPPDITEEEDRKTDEIKSNIPEAAKNELSVTQNGSREPSTMTPPPPAEAPLMKDKGVVAKEDEKNNGDGEEIAFTQSTESRREDQVSTTTNSKPASTDNYTDYDNKAGKSKQADDSKEENYRLANVESAKKKSEEESLSKKKAPSRANSNAPSAPQSQSTSPTTEGSGSAGMALDEAGASSKLEQEEEVFMIVEEMPSYPGGEEEMAKFIRKNIKYPTSAKENNIQGTVYVNFIVNKDGSVTDAKITRGISQCPDCATEALRVVKLMPKWNAGKQNGKPVKVSYTLPVKFSS